VALRLLREATRWKPCFAVRHPETCSSEDLDAAIAHSLPEAAIAAERAGRAAEQPAKGARGNGSGVTDPMSSKGRRKGQGASEPKQRQPRS
jgi:hypothetical protein